MLIFIIPLQSPEVSKDWKLVSLLTERTLRSVCRQTDASFRAVLVCNRSPEMAFTHPALTIIEEDFPIPALVNDSLMNDKWLKLKRGMIFARQWAPAHVMFVDADDCVSRRLSATVAQDPGCAGWFVQDGYMHDAQSRWVFRRSNFHQYCGTSNIMHCSADAFPTSMSESTAAYPMLDAGHTGIVARMRELGRPLRALPFPGAIYNTGTGENESGISLRNWRSKKVLFQKLLNYRLLTNAIREEFGLYEISCS